MEDESKRLTARGIQRPVPNPQYESSALALMKLEHSIEMDAKKSEQDVETQRNHWESCCFSIHAESSKFFAKLFISSAVIGLCTYQLINVDDCGSQHMYSGMLGIILGSYLK
jgi:hypothetical protein